MLKRRRPQPSGPRGVPFIAGYSELAVIGHGSSATVYRGRQDGFGRTVAIKVLHVDISDRRAQRRFDREREINGRLSHHPNVVTVLDAGFVDGRHPYLAMELCEQGSLAQRLADRGPLPVAEALQLVIRIAGALETAHRAGVLHRDIKPQNILLTRFGEPALADFGIATILELDQSMTAALTPVHAAPEILEGEEPSPASDVYSLGSTLYTLLSGTPPFAGPPGEGMLAQLLRIATTELPTLVRGDVPPSLFATVQAATAKQRDQRTPSAAALGRALQEVQSELRLGTTPLPVETLGDLMPAPPPSPRAAGAAPPQPPPPTATPATPADGAGTVTVGARPAVRSSSSYPRRRMIVVAAAGAGAAIAGAGAAVWVSGSQEGRPPPSVENVAGVASSVAASPAATSAPATPTSTASSPAFATLPESSAAVAIAPPPASDPDDEAVDSVRVSTESGSVIVTFRDRSDGRRHRVHTFTNDADVSPQWVDAGVTIHVVRGLDPGTPACFVVAAVVELGGGPVPAHEVWSDPECINGAVPAAAATSGSSSPHA